ncbi:MAG: HAMP domain-containing protein [Lachnospiraceae bacterium]|nr:HAMP domain-containing protein [Lachnospiraceae bacterium]
MRLKTRLVVTFVVIIVVPVALMLIAYALIGTRLAGESAVVPGSSVGKKMDMSAFLMFVNPYTSQAFLVYLIVCLVLILFFTALFLTQWIHRGVFEPVSDLNEAMSHIASGDLDYKLPVDPKDRTEIGELYLGYEDMRRRLKESADGQIEDERRQKELIGNITHDLKTPITAVKGYAMGIMEGVADTPDKVDRYVRTIYNKSDDMEKLINELTMYVEIDSNMVPYHFQTIDIDKFLSDCVEELRLDLEPEGIAPVYSGGVSAMVVADPEQLKRVFDNIVTNSVKYKSENKLTLNIRLLDEVDSVRVEIEDNGIGIDEKDLPHVFERLYRADASRSSATGGSGIGLSIAKKIVEDHGGYIWATSIAGEGTCMRFVLRKVEGDLKNA